jgi:hypothetical protein
MRAKTPVEEENAAPVKKGPTHSNPDDHSEQKSRGIRMTQQKRNSSLRQSLVLCSSRRIDANALEFPFQCQPLVRTIILVRHVNCLGENPSESGIESSLEKGPRAKIGAAPVDLPSNTHMSTLIGEDML